MNTNKPLMIVTRKWLRTLHTIDGEVEAISVQAEGDACSVRFTVDEERQAPLIGAEVSVRVDWK